MTKISKNIKRLRTSKGMSQDALAEKLFISRQAVSSWENDRTQQDVDMISNCTAKKGTLKLIMNPLKQIKYLLRFSQF